MVSETDIILKHFGIYNVKKAGMEGKTRPTTHNTTDFKLFGYFM